MTEPGEGQGGGEAHLNYDDFIISRRLFMMMMMFVMLMITDDDDDDKHLKFTQSQMNLHENFGSAG